MGREALLTHTLTELAETLVDDFDLLELLTLLTERSVDILDVSEVGIMLASPNGDLGVVASSSEKMRILELFELQAEEGPCLDCFRTAAPVVHHDLTKAHNIWPLFAVQCSEAGFQSVQALPMRLRGETIGALNLFRADKGEVNDADMLSARTLANLATMAVHLHISSLSSQIIGEQLLYVLDSRIVIEQAKGMVSDQAAVSVEMSFGIIRRYALSHKLGLVDVAQNLINGTLTANSMMSNGAGPDPS